MLVRQGRHRNRVKKRRHGFRRNGFAVGSAVGFATAFAFLLPQSFVVGLRSWFRLGFAASVRRCVAFFWGFARSFISYLPSSVICCCLSFIAAAAAASRAIVFISISPSSPSPLRLRWHCFRSRLRSGFRSGVCPAAAAAASRDIVFISISPSRRRRFSLRWHCFRNRFRSSFRRGCSS